MEPSSTTDNTIPFRASCDRCRAHKLRCVPSGPSSTPDRNAKAPCQRCVKANTTASCIFGRTGRHSKSSLDLSNKTSNSNNQNQNNKVRPSTRDRSSTLSRGSTTPLFPGMGTFVLPDVSNPSRALPPQDVDGRMASSEPPSSSFQDININTGDSGTLYSSPTTTIDDVDLERMFTDSWNSHLHLDRQFEQSNMFMFGTNAPMYESEDISRSSSMPPTPQNGIASDFLSQAHMNMDMASGKPGPLNELAVLLAEMPLYEDRLSRHSHGNLLTYPIGDALYLTLRFRAILSGRSECSFLNSKSGEGNMPAMLLTLSCYMTLVTIYLSIFSYFATNLSLIMAASDSRYNNKLQPHACNAEKYRGLRLDQLQPICLCSGWNPIKKAVLMLLCSLSSAETILGLPDDARVTLHPPQTVWFEASDETCGIFDEGLMDALINSTMYKDARRKAMELRDKVREVEALVLGVSEIFSLSP